MDLKLKEIRSVTYSRQDYAGKTYPQTYFQVVMEAGSINAGAGSVAAEFTVQLRPTLTKRHKSIERLTKETQKEIEQLCREIVAHSPTH